jgi:hypothetical protein
VACIIFYQHLMLTEYAGRSFLGMAVYCCKRNEVWTFRVDRILEIKNGKVERQPRPAGTPGRA